MLDDLKYTHQRDASDALGIAEKQSEQLVHLFDVEFKPKQEITNIVVSGMGGSAWPAEYLMTWPHVSLPMEINRLYTASSYVNEKTLFIASSYSGNTEETLSALDDAMAKNAQIVIMASGGKLMEIAKEKGFALYQIPSGAQPRMCSFYFIAALMQLLEPLGYIKSGSTQELGEVANWLKTKISEWSPTIPTSANLAKKIAMELVGKAVIVYSGPLTAPAAHKWKICISETAKNLSWWNQYSELNHNEMTGWTGQPLQKPFAVVEIRSSLENDRIKKRFELSERMLSGRRPTPQIVSPEGDSAAQQLFWASALGDFVSIYLALLNNVDPSPVDFQENFKTELA